MRQFPWRDDFAAARNFTLTAAAETGTAWTVSLDPDERLDRSGIDIRSKLAAAKEDVLHVAHADGSYAKERFFRLPARGCNPDPPSRIQAGPNDDAESR